MRIRYRYAAYGCKLETCGNYSHGETPGVEIRVDEPTGERLDAYLAARLPDLSRSRIQALIREQFIVVNGNPAKPRDAVKPGATISIAIPEAVPLDASPEDIPLDILYEDDHLVVLNKAPGLAKEPLNYENVKLTQRSYK